MRRVAAVTLLVAVLVGGFFIAATNTICDESCPDW